MSTGSKPIFVFPFCLFVCLYLGKVAVKLETIDILITFHLCSSQEIMKSSWKFTKTETEAPQNFRKVKNEKEKKKQHTFQREHVRARTENRCMKAGIPWLFHIIIKLFMWLKCSWTVRVAAFGTRCCPEKENVALEPKLITVVREIL